MGQEKKYTYYGFIPSQIHLYVLNEANNLTSDWKLGSEYTGSPLFDGKNLAVKSMVAVVAVESDTNVEVYDLMLGRLVSKRSLGSMEKHLVLLANGTAFKVVSDKLVSVLLLNYQSMPSADVSEGPLPHTFYMSVNGLCVDKEFVFMASERVGEAENRFYTIFALETSTVTVTRDDGEQNEYSLAANAYRYLMFRSFRAYRIKSTGNIMVQSGHIDGGSYGHGYFVPCAEGGFVGRNFYARSTRSWDIKRNYGYRISAIRDTSVTVYNLETHEVLQKLSVKGESGVGFMPSAPAIAVQSDAPVTLAFLDNGTIGTGVMFIGIRPGQDTVFYLPTEAYVEAYFFATEETQVTIDDFAETIRADTPFLFTQPGTHKVHSDGNLILQVNYWPNQPDYQGLWFTGATVPCIETINIDPDVKLTPFEEGFPTMYLIIGVGVAATTIIAFLLVMTKRKSMPE
ncbi:hypothetical protein KEJ18_05245 [Candidatus Bathyarchaeota archaeon]|nr:hypothetical protein [Candidatus Bathyarchaeota archaeon]